MSLTRRCFMQASGEDTTPDWAIAGFAATGVGASTLPEPTAAHLPRWRGFNLLEEFINRSMLDLFRAH